MLTENVEMSDKILNNNTRIAKNTLLLYFRMLFMMIVSLYTSRVVLQTLGVIDFGIYNVVGGVISMFAFLNSAMASTAQRFLTYEIGANNKERLRGVFITSIQIHGLISIVILLLSETLGLWLVLTTLVIPSDRIIAAMWVYQCSVFTTIVSFMAVPYNAVIIAHEKMSAFAYISLLEVLLKLVIAYLIIISPFDKLIFYAVALFIAQVCVRQVYNIYAHRHFEETHYQNEFNRNLFREMFGFAGWSFIGNFAGMLYSQGLNMLLNVFFGPVVNAARGIAIQVQSAVQQLVANFQMAINPQITKSYATQEFDRMHSLMFRSTRFSFFLLYILTLPILLEIDFILQIWLGQVPENAALFTRIMICISMSYTFANPCMIANQATGNVKKYQTCVSTVILMILPISYILLKIGAPAYSVFLVQLTMELIAQIPRIYILRRDIKLPIYAHFVNVYIPILKVVVIASILPMFSHMLISNLVLRFIVTIVVSVFSCAATIYYIGMTENEKVFIKNKIKKLAHRHE